jgi:hypothetical protein
MTPINLGLWVILVAMLALIPMGCYFTRRPKTPPTDQ